MMKKLTAKNIAIGVVAVVGTAAVTVAIAEAFKGGMFHMNNPEGSSNSNDLNDPNDPNVPNIEGYIPIDMYTINPDDLEIVE